MKSWKLPCLALAVYLGGSALAEADCPYIQPYQANAAKRVAILGRLNAVKEQCSPEGLALMRQLYPVLQEHDAVEEKAMADPRCKMDPGPHAANVQVTNRLSSTINSCTSKLASKTAPADPAKSAASPAQPARNPTANTAAAAPSTTAKSFLRCASDSGASTITGLPDDKDNERASAVHRADRQCLAAVKWTRGEPYNHGKSPVVVRTQEGVEIAVPFGESLWSIKDESAPRGRRLVSRKWNNEPVAGTTCAQEGTSATTKDFPVSIICELGRQADRQTQFESREDNCIAPARCLRKPDYVPDWRSKPARYWLENPQQPIGTCVITTRDNRDDRRCVREENWHTATECKQYGQSVQTNARGLSGCTYNEGVVTAPGSGTSSKTPDHPSATWLVISGSWPPDQAAKATERLSLLSSKGIKAQIVKTNAYPKLVPDLLAVVSGPFDKAEAELNMLQIQSFVPDAFIKEAK